jgi:epoxyqueuosine reductase
VVTHEALARAKAAVLDAARGAGARAVRVCSARADGLDAERFRASIARGDLATWPYDRVYAERATAPQTLLADARSVVCVAIPYATPAPSQREPLTGRISNYAWAADYHAIVRRVLEAVGAALDDAAGAPVTRVACDTAPIAERAFAARAGLGWIGKHTNLIAPALGSFVFLGEVVTSLELPEDPPLRKSCGSCARCVVACPTGALRGDYTIDATRCISDLTQRRDAIPREMRPLMGDWVWGCDLCQEVCPPTRRAPAAAPPAFAAPTAASAFAGLQQMLELRSREFGRRFGRTAIGWRGATVLRRNAALALGNSLDRAAVPSLARALAHDASPLVRGHAAWALGRIGSPGALSALSHAAALERSYDVQCEIACALEPFEREGAFDARRSTNEEGPVRVRHCRSGSHDPARTGRR